METPLSIFLPFTRLPKELRLKIWYLTLPARTIEQTWNNSKCQWEFDAKVRNVLQDAQALYRKFDDVQPFYFCPEVDTIYVPRQCLSAPLLL
jgi:2EXR family